MPTSLPRRRRLMLAASVLITAAAAVVIPVTVATGDRGVITTGWTLAVEHRAAAHAELQLAALELDDAMARLRIAYDEVDALIAAVPSGLLPDPAAVTALWNARAAADAAYDLADATADAPEERRAVTPLADAARPGDLSAARAAVPELEDEAIALGDEAEDVRAEVEEAEAILAGLAESGDGLLAAAQRFSTHAGAFTRATPETRAALENAADALTTSTTPRVERFVEYLHAYDAVRDSHRAAEDAD